MGGSQDLNTVLVTLIPQDLGTSLDLGLPGQRWPRWAAYHRLSFGFSSGKARPQTISPFLPSSEIATSHKASHRQSRTECETHATCTNHSFYFLYRVYTNLQDTNAELTGILQYLYLKRMLGSGEAGVHLSVRMPLLGRGSLAKKMLWGGYRCLVPQQRCPLFS